MNERKHLRFPVQFNSYFASPKADEGLGVVADMSTEGCLITSEARVQPGTALRVRISLPEINLHVQVAKAEVRWARDGQFGLEFKELSDQDSRNLQLAVMEFEKRRET